MTAPIIPSALQGVLTPLAPSTSTVPSAPAPTDKRKVASPFYLRYLNDQATAIRLRARELGEDEDAAVNQFLDLEERQKVALLPGSAEATQAEVDAANKPTYLQGVSRAVLQGATFGFGDEALGALYGMISPDITSAEGIAQYRREYESWARENRKTAIGAEFAGALGATLLTAGAAGAATPGILRMSATAGAAGAVSGAGHAQGDIDNRLWGALLGSATGFAGGVVLGGAGRYAVAPLVRAAASSPAGQKIGGAVESSVKRVTAHELVSVTPEARMRELLTKTLLAEGITYDKALRAVDDLERAGVKASILAVGGDAVRDLVGSAAKMRSPFTTKFLEDLKRSEAQVGPDMIHALLEKGVAPQRLGLAYAYDLKDALERQALAASKLPYEATYQQVVNVTPMIAKRLQHPKLREAWERVVLKVVDDTEVGRGHGLPVPSLLQRPIPSQLPVRGIDELKRELDAMVEDAFPPIQTAAKDAISKQNKRKAEYRKTLFALYDDVVKETVAQVPVYGRALSAYGGPMEVRDLVQLGEKAWRMKGTDIARKLARIEPSKREFVRIGYARAAYEAMIAPGKSPRNVAERFFGGRTLGENSLRAEQIRALFPEDPLKAAEFLRLSAGQARVTEATGGVLRLARQVVTEQKKDIVEGAPVPIRGQLGLTIASGAERVAQRFRASLTQEEADELTYLAAKGLSNPADLRALLNDLFYTYAGTHVKRSVRKPLTRALGEVAGSLPSKAF